MNTISMLKHALSQLPSSSHLVLWDQVNDQYFEIAGMGYRPDISISLIPITKEQAYDKSE